MSDRCHIHKARLCLICSMSTPQRVDEGLGLLRIVQTVPPLLELTRSTIAAALAEHRIDGFNQDSGKHCVCGSGSRFEQRGDDHPWETIDEHRADVVIRALS